MLHIELLAPAREEEYDAFLGECPAALLYHSRKYRNLLQRILGESTPFYLAAYESGALKAVLPAFIGLNPRLGNVLNSLPFFGSHGGVLCAPDSGSADALHDALFAALNDLCRAHSVVSATLIVNPFAPLAELRASRLGWPVADTRIGQVTPLPAGCRDDAEIDERLFRLFHGKTRNSIRKAQRSAIQVGHGSASETLHALISLHEANIEALNGISKPHGFFAAVTELFRYDDEYRIYTASKDGAIIAALLVFYTNGTAEYFTPATAPHARTLQPMSLLAFEAMREAVRRGFFRWNWGGTWPSQRGVYHFKKRWGAVDVPYAYHGVVRANHLLNASSAQLLQEYPYYYVVPFGRLNEAGSGIAGRVTSSPG